jgi:hypothetical protein
MWQCRLQQLNCWYLEQHELQNEKMQPIGARCWGPSCCTKELEEASGDVAKLLPPCHTLGLAPHAMHSLS